MLRNLSAVALRNLKKYWAQSSINLLGLSVGFLSVAMIGLFIDHELNYDRFHRKPDTIFRITDPFAIGPNPWAPALAGEFPEIETYTRVQKRLRFNPLVSNGDTRFFEDGFISVDSTFFRVFDFRLKSGDINTALRDPGSIVITESKARKFFGDEDPLDKVLLLDNLLSLRVTGVLEDLPSQSHLQFNYILPIDSLLGNAWVYSYFRIAEGTDLSSMEKKIQPFLKARFAETHRHRYAPQFQRLTDIHLHSDLEYEFRPNGNFNQLRLMGGIGMLILLVASFNFVSLTTAMVSRRLKEFGMRKILGSLRSQLLLQSVVESVLACVLAFCVALALGFLVAPLFSNLLARQMDWGVFVFSYGLTGLLFAILVGVLSGFYPSLLISGIKPDDALRGKFSPRSGPGWFGKSLVGAQYVIAAILLTGTLVIYKQLDMLSSRNLGFDRSQVIVINGRIADGLEVHMKKIAGGFGQLPEVEHVAFSQTVPGDYRNLASIRYEFEGVDDNQPGTKTIFVSADFVETLGITMASGRDFSDEFKSDSATYVINEACARMAGWENPLGKKMRMTIIDKMEGPVIGVMKDFHFASLHSTIEPVVLAILPESFQKILIRTQPNTDAKTTVDKLSSEWSRLMPGYPFEYQFMDEKFDDLYEADEQFSRVFRILTFIGILLTCMGVYGMVALETGRRMKEIGIRKVVGASVLNIFLSLNGPILAIITGSLALSVPLTWYLLSGWLSNFAYSISIEWWFFLLSFAGLVVVSILTTGVKIFRAAVQNPVQVLREG
jgi:putative ABC transport system permease protein